MLSAIGLKVRRGPRVILTDVSLTARAGEYIGVVGANGAGKSTLLNLLAGLLRPDSGHVELGGRLIDSISRNELARMRAYLPQNPRCEWPISVEQLVALGLTPTLTMFRDLLDTDRDKITQALSLTDMVGHRRQASTSLSGGELARAMLARALIGDPSLLIVDEPIAGLDPRHAIQTMRRLRAFAQDGRLVIAALHDLTLAARFTTRIVALREGRVEADGPTLDVLTAQMIRRVFEIDARVVSGPHEPYVDYALQ